MSGINGVEAMKAIKIKRDVPIIAVTGITMENDKKNLFDQGFDDYISKPIDIQLLNTKIQHLL